MQAAWVTPLRPQLCLLIRLGGGEGVVKAGVWGFIRAWLNNLGFCRLVYVLDNYFPGSKFILLKELVISLKKKKLVPWGEKTVCAHSLGIRSDLETKTWNAKGSKLPHPHTKHMGYLCTENNLLLTPSDSFSFHLFPLGLEIHSGGDINPEAHPCN